MDTTGPWEPGDPIPVLEVNAVNRVQIAKFAAATGDFNPIHCDEEFARKSGFPSVIAHGPLTLSLVARARGRTVGPHNIRAVHAQFRAPVLPGDLLRVEGTVKSVTSLDGENQAECELQVVRGEGEIVAAGGGRAVVQDA